MFEISETINHGACSQIWVCGGSKDATFSELCVISLAIQKEMTIDELSFSKFFFYPYFNLPNDLLVKAAQESEKK